MFEKLKDAYVKARDSKHYRISAEELTWLGTCVEELGRIVQTICLERIQDARTQCGRLSCTSTKLRHEHLPSIQSQGQFRGQYACLERTVAAQNHRRRTAAKGSTASILATRR